MFSIIFRTKTSTVPENVHIDTQSCTYHLASAHFHDNLLKFWRKIDTYDIQYLKHIRITIFSISEFNPH